MVDFTDQKIPSNSMDNSLLRLLVGTVLNVAKEDIGSLRTLGVLGEKKDTFKL